MLRRTFLASHLAAAGMRAEEGAPGVLVYGATPAGIAATLAAASAGESVVLVEPTARIGGLMTCGLSHTDLRTFEAITGAYFRFTRLVLAHYEKVYGKDAPQVRDSLRGTQVEPKVAHRVFVSQLAAYPKVLVLPRLRLRAANVAGGRIRSVVLQSDRGRRVTLSASQFIDASYEGDLMAAAGARFHVGREGRAEFNEPLAPPAADSQLQGYNFRLIATREASNRVAPAMPAGYRREDFTGVLPLLADGRIARVFDSGGNAIFKAQIPSLPNGKFDINDVSHSPVRLSLPGENGAWPEGDEAARQKIFDAHLLWSVGLLYFLQNDEAVPERYRAEAREWGWCRDEFTESGHLPPQLYVREARRMRGMRVFVEGDTSHAPGDARSVFHADSIAMGDYGPNCHGTSHEGPRFGGRHTGEFYKPSPPYQIPYGTLVPREISNLLVPGAASASHVGFCALRLEPIWMSLGEAAGHAANLAARTRQSVQSVKAGDIQKRLHASGAATIYVSDVPPGHANFAAVQWWGQQGGLHGLNPEPASPGERGANIIGQYFRAFPGHAAELERTLDEPTLSRWRQIVAGRGGTLQGLTATKLAPARGEFILAAWRGRRRPSAQKPARRAASI